MLKDNRFIKFLFGFTDKEYYNKYFIVDYMLLLVCCIAMNGGLLLIPRMTSEFNIFVVGILIFFLLIFLWNKLKELEGYVLLSSILAFFGIIVNPFLLVSVILFVICSVFMIALSIKNEYDTRKELK